MSKTPLTEVIGDHRSNCFTLLWKGYLFQVLLCWLSLLMPSAAPCSPSPPKRPQCRAPSQAGHPPPGPSTSRGSPRPQPPPLLLQRGWEPLGGGYNACVPHMLSITNPKRSAVTRLLITLFRTPSVKPLGFNSGNFSQSSSIAYSSKGLPFLADWKRGFSHISALQKEKTIISETSQ